MANQPDWWDEWYKKLLESLRQRFQHPQTPGVSSINPWSYLWQGIPDVQYKYPTELWGMFMEAPHEPSRWESAKKGVGTKDVGPSGVWDTEAWMKRMEGMLGKPLMEYERVQHEPKFVTDEPLAKLRPMLNDIMTQYQSAQAQLTSGEQFEVASRSGSKEQLSSFLPEIEELKGRIANKETENREYQMGRSQRFQEALAKPWGQEYSWLSDLYGKAWQRKMAGMQGIQHSMGLGTQAGIATQSANLKAAQIGQQGWLGALSGLQGFRGQDIQLLLRELQMQMRRQQTAAQSDWTKEQEEARRKQGYFNWGALPGWGMDQLGCVITSACMEAKGLPDDCHELQALRKLRSWMEKNQEGKALVGIYEIIAPPVVRKINALTDSKKHWKAIYEKGVLPAVKLVKRGKNVEAVAHYSAMIKILIKNYLSSGGELNAIG